MVLRSNQAPLNMTTTTQEPSQSEQNNSTGIESVPEDQAEFPGINHNETPQPKGKNPLEQSVPYETDLTGSTAASTSQRKVKNKSSQKSFRSPSVAQTEAKDVIDSLLKSANSAELHSLIQVNQGVLRPTIEELLEKSDSMIFIDANTQTILQLNRINGSVVTQPLTDLPYTKYEQNGDLRGQPLLGLKDGSIITLYPSSAASSSTAVSFRKEFFSPAKLFEQENRRGINPEAEDQDGFPGRNYNETPRPRRRQASCRRSNQDAAQLTPPTAASIHEQLLRNGQHNETELDINDSTIFKIDAQSMTDIDDGKSRTETSKPDNNEPKIIKNLAALSNGELEILGSATSMIFLESSINNPLKSARNIAALDLAGMNRLVDRSDLTEGLFKNTAFKKDEKTISEFKYRYQVFENPLNDEVKIQVQEEPSVRRIRHNRTNKYSLFPASPNDSDAKSNVNSRSEDNADHYSEYTIDSATLLKTARAIDDANDNLKKVFNIINCKPEFERFVERRSKLRKEVENLRQRGDDWDKFAKVNVATYELLQEAEKEEKIIKLKKRYN